MTRTKRKTTSLSRRKLLRAAVVLVFAGVVLLLYQAAALRASLLEDLNLQAEMIADNVSASVMFADPSAATEILRSLDKVPYLESANVYTRDGKRFASYAKPGIASRKHDEGTLASAKANLSHPSLRNVFVTSTISLHGNSLGVVVLVAQTNEMRAQLLDYAFFLAAASLSAISIAFAVTSRMGARVAATASVGVSVYPDDATDVASLVSSADIALYTAKSKGKNTAVEFHPAMTIEARRRARLEAKLREAINTDSLELVYQPQFNSRTGALLGAEALIRWFHPRDGAISPVEFIPIAEDSGLIVPLGQWVLRRACRDAARWNGHSRAAIYVAVNVSAHQLRHAGFTDDVKAELEQSGLAANLLEVELTESQLMANMGSGIEAMRRLRAAGVRLALDDFGTGYSSLSYLQSFPVNRIKIDRSFIHPLPESGQPIVTAIISMAHSLGMAVVAEGVEAPAQLTWLTNAGCDIVQGFLTGRPMSFDQFMGLVRDKLPHVREALPARVVS